MPGRTRGAVVVAALTSLLMTATPASACPAQGDTAVVCEINAQRRAFARPPVAMQDALDRAAGRYARDMVRRGFFSHTSPSGSTMVDRLRSAGYLTDGVRWYAGEVLAWGSAELGAPAAIVAAWMRSPPHRRILLGRVYRDIGVGIATGTPAGVAGATYAAELGSVGP
jgi:uncharacterized protein YkwD